MRRVLAAFALTACGGGRVAGNAGNVLPDAGTDAGGVPDASPPVDAGPVFDDGGGVEGGGGPSGSVCTSTGQCASGCCCNRTLNAMHCDIECGVKIGPTPPGKCLP